VGCGRCNIVVAYYRAVAGKSRAEATPHSPSYQGIFRGVQVHLSWASSSTFMSTKKHPYLNPITELAIACLLAVLARQQQLVDDQGTDLVLPISRPSNPAIHPARSNVTSPPVCYDTMICHPATSTLHRL
jgi:hypothetical protein